MSEAARQQVTDIDSLIEAFRSMTAGEIVERGFTASRLGTSSCLCSKDETPPAKAARSSGPSNTSARVAPKSSR